MQNTAIIYNTNKLPHVKALPVLGGCLLLSAAVCVAQVLGNSVILLLCLLGYLVFTVWACNKGIVFPVLLYFLPWSPLLKMYNGGISFFTIALLLCCMVSLLQNKMSLRLYQIILAALLMALTLVTKAIQHNPIGNDYLCFLIMLLLFPCVMQGSIENISFYRITIFFACGIVSAALTAQQIATFPNISQFITVNSYLTVTRLSGFYGDPNFYSAHISACLAGIQLLLCYEKGRRNQLVLAILALILLYCGLLSASKSFIIVTACLFLLWVPILLEKGASSSRFRLFMGVLCAGIVIASSSAFQALLQIVDDRFAQASNMSELTTGRTDLWKNYIHEFLYNPITLLFGEGYTSINLNNKGSHNTLIQLVYQFGLIGIPFLVSWVVISLRNLFAQFNVGRVQWKHVLLVCVGVALPWMGIDKATDTLMTGAESSCAECAQKHNAACAIKNAGFIDGTQLSKIQNMKPSAANTSGCRGVSFNKKTLRWEAQIKFRGKRTRLGSYKNFDDAVLVRKKAEQAIFGEFLDSLALESKKDE